jgi:microcystin-dependent protein
MTDPFLGEIRMFSFAGPPQGWALCNGQTMSITGNQPLFSLLGTNYGGDGRTTFALPDLRNSAPMHVDPTHGTRNLGEKGGEAAHTLLSSEVPRHTHVVSAFTTASTSLPAGARWAALTQPGYAATPDTAMSAAAISNAGGSQPHQNMPPYLVITFAIATVGIFPSRN